MSFVLSPNMSLSIPTVGQEPGPDFAFDINSSLTLIDQHDHSPGKGIQITPAGLNINGVLSFNNNPATNLSYESFTTMSSPSSVIQSISVSPASSINELWYTDSNGAQTQITKNGAVNVVASSIPGESYAAGTFIWTQTQSALPTTPANFDIGSITLRPNIAATTNGVTLIGPTAAATSFTFPNYTSALTGSLPGSSQLLQMDTSGNIHVSGITVSGSQISGSSIQNLTITAAQIANLTITNAQISTTAGILPSKLDSITSGNYVALSSSSGSFVTTSSSFVNVTNLVNIGPSVLVTTRPVFINFVGGEIGVETNPTTDISIAFQIIRSNSTVVSTFTMRSATQANSNSSILSIPCGALNCIDTVPNGAAATYTLQVRIQANSGAAGDLLVTNVKMQVLQV